MEARDIILRPVITEASMAGMDISVTLLMLIYEQLRLKLRMLSKKSSMLRLLK